MSSVLYHTHEGLVSRGSQLGLPSEGLTWPLCPMVVMGTVPVLQEAGRAVSCFEEGLRAVFLQSAYPKRGRKPRARRPCCWVCGAAMPTPSQPGGAVVEMQPREKAKQASRRKKKMAGRKRVVTSSTDLGSYPVVIKTLSWSCPAPDSPPPELSFPWGSEGQLDKGL